LGSVLSSLLQIYFIIICLELKKQLITKNSVFGFEMICYISNLLKLIKQSTVFYMFTKTGKIKNVENI